MDRSRWPVVKLDLPGALANLRREGTPRRVFQFEHGIEPGVRQALCDRFGLCDGLELGDPAYAFRRDIRIHQFVGLELLRVLVAPAGLVWKGNAPFQLPPAVGPIQSWADFEAYPWPRLEQVDFAPVDWHERHLPDNMGLWCVTYLFQQVSNLIGFEPLCLMVYEQPDLVRAVMDKVGAFYLGYTQQLCAYSRFTAICLGDDMGHKSGTFLDPRHIRELFMPWHARLAAAAHARGKLCILHSCGNVAALMDDLIDGVGIDAHHSTQDVVLPIAESKRRWGARVALLGGIDVDFLTRARVEQVRPYVRRILDACVPGGGFALGVGNWVADSIPVDNYLAVLEEARSYRV